MSHLTASQASALILYARRYAALLRQLNDPKRADELAQVERLANDCEPPAPPPPSGMLDANGNVR